MELANLFKSPGVIDETHLMLPGQLIDFALQQRDAFCKIRRVDAYFLQHLAGFQFYSAQTRMTNLARALEQLAVMENESLGICTRVVRPGMDHLIAVNRNRDFSQSLEIGYGGRLASQGRY